MEFDSSSTRIVGSNTARDMNICNSESFCFVLSCAVRDTAIIDLPPKETYHNV